MPELADDEAQGIQNVNQLPLTPQNHVDELCEIIHFFYLGKQYVLRSDSVTASKERLQLRECLFIT